MVKYKLKLLLSLETREIFVVIFTVVACAQHSFFFGMQKSMKHLVSVHRVELTEF